ncbi:NAD-dependent deacetylase [Actinospica durhamensis]|uniref:NAD-dependent deacetylase n=1 Tax=Actinospica durhamensis TaxID=1508375 RepID=UPI0034D6086E
MPDFRGSEGVWTRNPVAELSADIVSYLRDPELRARAWLARRDNPARGAQPNAGHLALVELERQRSVRILTQNVDRLHVRAGSSPRKVLELHGNMFEVVCTDPKCGWTGTLDGVLARIEAGEPDPKCERSGGILKPATVMFGQQLDPEVIGRAAQFARASAVFLAVGTSLRVHPAAGLCEVAVAAGADLVIVNDEATPYDELATELIREPISEALPKLVGELSRVSSATAQAATEAEVSGGSDGSGGS